MIDLYWHDLENTKNQLPHVRLDGVPAVIVQWKLLHYDGQHFTLHQLTQAI